MHINVSLTWCSRILKAVLSFVMVIDVGLLSNDRSDNPLFCIRVEFETFEANIRTSEIKTSYANELQLIL